jgi:predicted lipoprotein with Yx(FWY)xxD motif
MMDVRAVRRGSLGVMSMVVLLLAGCGGGSGGSSGASSGQGGTAPTATPAAAALVKTASKSVAGSTQTILVDAKGMTLYYYTPDKGTGKATCAGACLQNWPPLLLPSGTSKPTGDKTVTGTLGTLANPAAGTQVTYNGWPLYYYVKDTGVADTSGQNVGGKWFVVPPDVASAI